MARLIISADGPERFTVWKEAFAKAAPDLTVCSWYAPETEVLPSDYVLVWQPEDEHYAALAQVKAILCTGAGVDHLLQHPDFPLHVPLVRMGGEQTAQLMADYVTWAAISLNRDARTWALQQQRHEWVYNSVARTTAETRIGIMGLGHLGGYVATHLARMGFQVAGWKRSRATLPDVQVYVGQEALPDFLSRTDILVNLLPSTPHTRDLVTLKFLENLPRGAGFINVGRGEHVVQQDLLQALNTGLLSGAVLDVVAPEPLPHESPLWDHPRITVTPHTASHASAYWQAKYIAQSITQLERGVTPALLCNPHTGY
ncbi:glyoxylate/hydroxypyruvate reductase A [Acetobacter cibinongensis]|uniref:D-isomer specific 2-hydroxyacid dehydrogenase n=1 Tax=Acetobacter cibinongensis TaxID=146475 RepID=A0A0D6N0Y3_9PROT|nr:glyoxylate/hydroxypyruvate reductase A [Acetobacter cibinongensis]GAN59228.1 D-isomer specific 2-hydroxyacid dehydrogenase [Acetobacter cibinongensis]GBQ19319.1 D-isomer specific 2-hydroxyacid dehydrogenase [Acetobacter cibinongensis NRIC 0482]GEL59606.1 glyoxylate/hydroxypyruvate reductase A [Acetobacter cibinongensis]